MCSDWVSIPAPLALESDVLLTVLCGPATSIGIYISYAEQEFCRRCLPNCHKNELNGN